MRSNEKDINKSKSNSVGNSGGYLPEAITFLSGVILCVMLFSWIGSIYNLPIQNILNTDGVRWMLRHVIPNFANAPIGIIFILLLGSGIAYHAGVFSLWKYYLGNNVLPHNSLSLKQKRALVLTVVTIGFYCAFLVIGIYSPWAFLLGITGGLEHSPFVEGFCFLVSFGFALAGSIYGFVSGQMTKENDIMQGMSSLIIKLAPAFVLMFFTSQLLAIADYTHIAELLHIRAGGKYRLVVEYIAYYAPFGYYYWRNA